MKIQNEWIIDETLWFMGSENERKAPFPFTLTFYLLKEKINRPKCKSKFLGYCVAFKDESQRNEWLNSVVICKQEFLSLPLIQI